MSQVGKPTTKGFYWLLRANAVAARALPDPSKVWVSHDVADELANAIQTFAANDIITRVGYAGGGSNARKYRTKPAAYAIAQEFDPNTADCGHTGVKNLGNDEFTCSNDDCDARFGRETAREVAR